jgi:glycosyltransferase involved in cell wall biosynthesis
VKQDSREHWERSSRLESFLSSPHLVIGVTSAQTCLVLSARIRALRAAGFRLTVVSNPGTLLESTAHNESADAVAIPMKRGVDPLSDCVSLWRLFQFLRKAKPDLVEFSTPKIGLLGLMAAALTGVPHRVYVLRGLKLETAGGWMRLLLLAAERIASRCAHVVLCTSQSLQTKSRVLAIAPASKLQLIADGSSHGVDTRKFSPGVSGVRARFGIPPDARVIGFVGRLTRDKGVPDLIEAFERIRIVDPKTYLLLVGWFDESEDTLALAVRRRITCHPQIVCTGFVPDTAPYYRAMDLLILPTVREGFPNVVLEASASGIPVITTYCTGACDSVLEGVTGCLVPARDPVAIYKSAVRLLDDARERHRLGEAGRAWVQQRFSDRRVGGLTAEFYANLLRTGVVSAAKEGPAMDWAAPLR